MSSHALLRKLFVYDEWANREVLENLRKSNAPSRSQKFLAHIIAAEILWLGRIRGDEQRMSVWPELSLAQCEEEIKKTAAGWRELLAESESKLRENVNYRNSKGEPWSSTVEDILMHVALHSAYHRGQIAADVRASGAEPAYTDYIHAVRQRFV